MSYTEKMAVKLPIPPENYMRHVLRTEAYMSIKAINQLFKNRNFLQSKEFYICSFHWAYHQCFVQSFTKDGVTIHWCEYEDIDSGEIVKIEITKRRKNKRDDDYCIVEVNYED